MNSERSKFRTVPECLPDRLVTVTVDEVGRRKKRVLTIRFFCSPMRCLGRVTRENGK